MGCEGMDIPFDLTCWYLNSRRIMELVGTDIVSRRIRRFDNSNDPEGFLRNIAKQVALKEAITEWLLLNKPPTLGQLVVKNSIKPGLLFTHYTNYYCKGLGKVREALSKGKEPPYAEIYSKLDNLNSKARLSCKYHHEHLTSNSSWSELTGQKRLMLIGLIKEISSDKIQATPYVIAYPISDVGVSQNGLDHWGNQFEIHVDSIDSFNKVDSINARFSRKDLKPLQVIPEAQIKSAFAEIIGEPTIPKDWGGERSDLFSSYVQLDGQRISTAFAFKGPAKFKPMEMADLGKNGDQIFRLFSEPAELFIIQHCHEITTPVRAHMRAFASQVGRLRLFCIINGYDTIRILKAYNKCGFNSSASQGKP